MRFLPRIGSALLVGLAVPGWAVEPTPVFAPAPAWTVATELHSAEAAKPNGPLHFLLSSSQEHISREGVENYIEYAAIPLNAAGLQALGNVTIPWNVGRADLKVHKVVIRRDGKDIDVLKQDDVLVLRRENNLEKAVLDGVRTVVIPAKGLEVGDTLSVAYSYKTKTTSILKHLEEIQSLAVPMPIGKVERRFLIADDVKVEWKVDPALPRAAISKVNGMTEHRFAATNVQPPEIPKHTPGRFKQQLIQVSAYPSWTAVADQLTPLFTEARRLRSASPLGVEAEKIATSTSDPGERMLKSLRLAQENVRYVALLLGEGAYVPSSAQETWERRFGDCKGKTALLLALLDKAGVAAEPMLVSNEYDDLLGEQLPSVFMFDHVLVRARIGDKSYYLDATDYGQRTLSELAIPNFSNGLPLRPGANLERLPYGNLDGPTREVTMTWDASRAVEGKYPYEAILMLRGAAAAAMRAKFAAATDTNKLDENLKNMVAPVSNDDLVFDGKDLDASDGSLKVRFKGTAAMDWSPFEGKRETRFSFSNGTVKWDADFDREKGPNKEFPVLIAERPYWERLTETVILPNGGKGYAVDAAVIDKPVAGSVIKRRTELLGDRMTTVSDFRHLQREISASDARAAIPVLEEVSKDYAYVVGPPERRKKSR